MSLWPQKKSILGAWTLRSPPLSSISLRRRHLRKRRKSCPKVTRYTLFFGFRFWGLRIKDHIGIIGCRVWASAGCIIQDSEPAEPVHEGVLLTPIPKIRTLLYGSYRDLITGVGVAKFLLLTRIWRYGFGHRSCELRIFFGLVQGMLQNNRQDWRRPSCC